MAIQKRDSKTPHPDDPMTPRDYDPTHAKEYPPDEEEITGEKEKHLAEDPGYEDDMTDEKGRPVGMRRTGEFIVPDENNIAGEGWTVPTREGGGWDHPVEPSLEEQIDEPETPGKTKQK